MCACIYISRITMIYPRKLPEKISFFGPPVNIDWEILPRDREENLSFVLSSNLLCTNSHEMNVRRRCISISLSFSLSSNRCV